MTDYPVQRINLHLCSILLPVPTNHTDFDSTWHLGPYAKSSFSFVVQHQYDSLSDYSNEHLLSHYLFVVFDLLEAEG